MNHRSLREVAKIATGLFIADLIGVIWFGSAGLFPLTILGVTWTSTALLPIALFDVAMIVLLVHWGWNMKLPIESPSEKNLLTIVGFIFLVVALVHLARLMFGWSLLLGDFAAPLWLSWVGVIITAYFSYTSFHFARRVKGR